ncbi:MAG: aryl-sulfate sulfotransferase, partial [Flavobacteriales bacterium]|nr:aryl-sulfate sulfotransferase [Flavobacteriales bacterium]
ELDADEQLVWEWHLADHFDFLEVDPARLTNPNNVDWSHCNALELDTDGNILLSNRHFNSIIKVNRSTGEVMWSLGGVSNDFDFVGDPGFWGQHDIRRLPNGHITLFDNGLADTHPCRGVEYALDEVAMTATPVWSRNFGSTTWSRAMGSMQRLEDGNTLVAWGALQPDNAAFTVYRPDSSRLCELRFADTLVTYRAYYFEELAFDLPRPGISCSSVEGGYLLSAEPGWPNYVWSNGATGQSTFVGALDTVYVEVPAGPMLGWFRSPPYVVASECITSGLEDRTAGAAVIRPNPVQYRVELLRSGTGRADLVLFDALGQVVIERSIADPRVSLDVTGIPSGVYFLRMDGHVHRLVKE